MIGINHLGKKYERLANQMFQYAAIKGIAKNRGFTYFGLGNIKRACKDWEKASSLGNAQATEQLQEKCS